MADRIVLSEKHGVNPGLDLCFYCGEHLPGDREAPRERVIDLEPCGACSERFKGAGGVRLIECYDDTATDPRPTGRWCVVTVEAFARWFTIPVPAERWAFMAEAVGRQLGLWDVTPSQRWPS